MTKPNTIFVCSHCEAQYAKWAGRCLECGQWSTIKQAENSNVQFPKNQIHAEALETKLLSAIESSTVKRLQLRIPELDRVFGGGIVPGSLVLLAGEPGIGKSTLALQLAAAVSDALYISGEESLEQIKMRAQRLEHHNASLQFVHTTNIDAAIATLRSKKPALVIIDSVQTMYSEEIEGGQGNPNQVRATGAKLMECAKSLNIPIVVIGHVTKDGTVAGPKTLEHLVDVVLSFEGERHHQFRLLRALKNRFGSTDEVGVFDMTEKGLESIPNPSRMLLSERGDNVPGSIVTCLLEGTRPLLVEIQALVSKTSFGYPVRKASGFDINRLHVLIAVLERRAGLNLGQYDVHINVVGGIRASEPAADLAVALAVASAYKDKALGKDLVAFGEIGLGGEIRSVRQGEKRIKESEQLGMKRVITSGIKYQKSNIKVIEVKNIQELITHT